MKELLFEKQDKGYRDFHAKLIPKTDKNTIIGVRIPDIRSIAKKAYREKNYEDFLGELPHQYYDENMLHALIINEMTDLEEVLAALDIFLPYVDNWAVCDALKPKPFSENKEKLLIYIEEKIGAEDIFSVRFAILMLMVHFLDEDFDDSILKRVASVRRTEYYIHMMIAWFFATALAKRWDETIVYIEGKVLDRRTHNKAIQKSIESRRISEEQKDYLRKLKI